MVNIGRPSTGCRTCRIRRIKCDERKPACQKCEFSRRECLGYRTETELRFRNIGQSSRSDVLQHESLFDWNYAPLLPSISIDTDSIALTCFMRNFVVPGNQPRNEASVNFELLSVIRTLYAASLPSAPSIPALIAIAWATSVPFASTQHCMGEARRKYTESISRLRVALQDPVTAKKDDTLLAVLLLGWIEVLTATSDAPPQIEKHINGAVSLVNLRGKDNYSNRSSKKMLTFVKTQLPFNPVGQQQSHKPLSDEVLKYEDQDQGDSTDPKDAPLRLANIALAIFSLRGEVDSLIASQTELNPLSVTSTLKKSRKLDGDLLTWRQLLPSSWETLSFPPLIDREDMLQDPSCVDLSLWLGSFAIYTSSHIAGMINQYRMNRIAVQTITATCATWLAAHLYSQTESKKVALITAIRDEAERICHRMVDEICASVPFHVGNLPEDPVCGPKTKDPSDSFRIAPSVGLHPSSTGLGAALLSTRPKADTSAQSPGCSPPVHNHYRSLTKNMGCYMMLQPLMIANAVPKIPELQKTWMLNQALELCRRTGMDSEVIKSKFSGNGERRFPGIMSPCDTMATH